MSGGKDSFEGTVRRAFARLTRDDLPRAAVARGWPVRTPEDFERLLLDHLKDDGAGGGLPTPGLVDLVLAVELGEGLLAGKLCCVRMSGRLQGACGEQATAAGEDPIRALLAAFARKKKKQLPM